MVWKEGMDGWVPASQVKGLFSGGDVQRQKPGPPPLSVVSSTPPVPQHLPLPWSDEERTASNPVHLWAKVGAGVCVLIGILCIASGDGAIFCLPFFSAAFLILGMTVFKHLMVLHGRWVPAEGGKGWVEFASGGIFRQEDGLVGTFVVLKNKKFIDIHASGQLVDSWRILSVDMKSLEIQDSTGRTRSFKKGKTLAEKQAALFDTRRITHLEGSWQPLTEASEWMQFTKDGAVVFSDGTAGRYTVVGEEPNEVIEMEMVDGLVREFRVVSLTPTQLVIAEGTEATTFRRLRTGSGKRRGAEATTGADPAAEGSGTEDEGGGTASKGFVGSLFSFFFRYKCPKCGHRSGKKQSSRIVDSRQEVRSLPEGSMSSPVWVQRVVDLTLWEYAVACQDCGHQWCERSTTMSKA